MTPTLLRTVFSQADFFMLRYETEYTPCTGITAVARQERRNFTRGLMLAPWCPELTASREALQAGKVSDVVWSLPTPCGEVGLRLAQDEFAPLILLDLPGRFLGRANPYDTPELKRDAVLFGVAVDAVLQSFAHRMQFVWGADWQSVPALILTRPRHHISLTLHNTFDESLGNEVSDQGPSLAPLAERRLIDGRPKTALEVGIELSDVVTTVNRGFAYGMREESIQRDVMAQHLRLLTPRVVGINNGGFSTLGNELRQLERQLRENLDAGTTELLRLKTRALTQLPADIGAKAEGKAVVVSMGRRVAQKLHDVLVESTRALLQDQPNLPLLVVFATVPGDASSPARLERIQHLVAEFPDNVLSYDGRISFYRELMTAADFNCMPSLYEPHGGAFEGTVLPIARAIDGLAEQICDDAPRGAAEAMNALWHRPQEPPTGLLFREPPLADPIAQRRDLLELLTDIPSPHNTTFRSMVEELSTTLGRAIDLRRRNLPGYARLVANALRQQLDSNWLLNLGGMLALVERARTQRKIV